MVDIRYVVLAGLLVAAALLIKKYPDWTNPILVALAVGSLATVVMFGV